MTDKLPFINSTGLIPKILDKIINAQTPGRYTTDFQSTVLGYGSGSARPFLPLLKRIGFLNSDGSPTDLYKEFRSDSQRGIAMAKAIKHGYAPLYKVNEYAHKVDKTKLKDAVIQVTGRSKNSSSVQSIVNTFEALKKYADFEVVITDTPTEESGDIPSKGKVMPVERDTERENKIPQSISQNKSMNLSYTINLNLPASKDPAVFAAIFGSLKEHLLNE